MEVKDLVKVKDLVDLVKVDDAFALPFLVVLVVLGIGTFMIVG